MTNKNKNKIIDRVIEFLHNKPLKSDMRIAADLIEELKLVKNYTIPHVVGRSEQFCSCSFVMIMRDVNTGVPFCANCGKEVNE